MDIISELEKYNAAISAKTLVQILLEYGQPQIYNPDDYYKPDIDLYSVVTSFAVYNNTIKLIKEKWAIYPGSNIVKLLFQNKTHLIQLDNYSIDIGENLILNPLIFSKSITMHISQVKKDNRYSGTYLMNLANALIYSLGFRYADLMDKSTILCSRDNKYSPLIFLRIFEGKLSSWYENFGYQTKGGDKELMKQVAIFPMSTIKKYVNQLFANKDNVDNVNNRKLMDIIYESEHETLGPFMVDLWRHNCDLYSYLLDLLLNSDLFNYNNFNLLSGLKEGYLYEDIMFKRF